MEKIISPKIREVVDLVLNSKKKVCIFFLIFPILFLIVFFNLLEMNKGNLFFMSIFLFSYCTTIFVLIINFTKIGALKARSCIYAVKRLNSSGRKSYQTHFNTKGREKPLIGAEIGVNRGAHAKQLLNFLNIKQLILVDPWKTYDQSQEDTFNPAGLDSNDQEYCYRETLKKFSNNPKVKIVRDYSVNAAKMFDDEYFDFVYIDGNHSYKEVKKDLESWYPKLKKYGTMCGDNYGDAYKDTIKAVSEFVYKYKLIINSGKGEQFWFVKVSSVVDL